MDDAELDAIEQELSDLLGQQGLAWIEQDVDALIAEDPERVEVLPEFARSRDRRVARLILLLEAIQRTTQTVVACDLELSAAHARHDHAAPWQFATEQGERLPIVDPQRVAATDARLRAVHGLGSAVASFQMELAGELGGALTLVASRADKVVETRLREATDVTRLWSETPELRYVVNRPTEEG